MKVRDFIRRLESAGGVLLLQGPFVQGRVLRVPAGVVGQVWRDGRAEATLSRFLRSLEVTMQLITVKIDGHAS